MLGSPEDVVSNYLSAEVIGHKSLNPIPNTSLYGLIWLSTTFYNKSLCVEGCVLAVPVVPQATTRLGPANNFA